MRKHLFAGATLTLLLVVISFLILSSTSHPRQVIQVISRDSGRLLYQADVGAQEVVILSYTHSVFGQEVREFYRVDNKCNLVFLGADLGAAVTQERLDADMAFTLGGDVKLIGPERLLEKLHLIVGETGKPALLIHGSRLDLYGELGPGARVEVTASGCK